MDSVREDDFRNWLNWRGATSEKAQTSRIVALRKIESRLAQLGLPHGDLETAYANDGFAQLRERLKQVRDDAKAGGTEYRLLLPESEQPLNRLTNMRSYVGQYGQFLATRTSSGNPDRFEQGIEQLRALFLGKIPDFENMRQDQGLYWDAEKSYKISARADVRAILAQDDISEAERGKAIYDRLCQSAQQGLPLSWRTRAEVQKAAPSLQARFYETIASLANTGQPAVERAENAARTLVQLRSEGLAGLRRGEVLNIVLSVLGSFEPNESCWFKTSLFDNVAKRLIGKGLFPNEPFQIEDFEEFQSLLIRIRAKLEEWDWNPESFEDVQGFLWVAVDKSWVSNGDSQLPINNEAVEAAMDECDRLGRDAFLEKHDYGVPKRYWVIRPANGRTYPAKAIAGVAHGYMPGGEPLTRGKFFGGQGEQNANGMLTRLGYQIVESEGAASASQLLNEQAMPGPYWFLGASYGRTDDQMARFIRDGIWEISEPSDVHREQVRSMLPGQRIAIKSTYVRRKNLPFDNRERPVSVMAIKATGTITANPGTGESVSVEWDAPFEPREWYHYTYQPTVWEVYPDKEMAKRLIAFAFGGKAQDYDWFLANMANWKDLAPGNDRSDELKPDRRKRDPQNIVLYGPPGTGKTYRTMAEAVRLCLGLDKKDALLNDIERRKELRAEYDRLRELGQISFVTFHQNFSYEDFIEGREPKPSANGAGFELVTRSGIFVRMAEAASSSDEEHVLIIDEINRANISKIFGELITLIERDKRAGMANALALTLPYSQSRFSVPANLHLIGTMNTADRSIALLDTALRRRFRFQEIEPDAALLDKVAIATGEPMVEVLRAINDRIEYMHDREHRIGHAFFLGCETRGHLDAVMRDNVIPLLQEYFFEDWRRVAAVLGSPGGDNGFLESRVLDDPFGEGLPIESWQVRKEFSSDAYRLLLGKAVVDTEAAIEKENAAGGA